MQRLAAVAVLALVFSVHAANQPDWHPKAEQALTKGATYLLAAQRPDGSWGDSPRVAITALCVTALANAPGVPADQRDAAIERAMKVIIASAKESGAVTSKPERHFLFFSDEGYPTYTTAVALLAMLSVHKEEYLPYERGAREFLKSVQVNDEGESRGGFGYKPGSRADMSNTAWAAEALYASRHLETDTGAEPSPVWTQLQDFLGKCQNLPADGAVKADQEDADGGFSYKPGMVSSGSMTYAGLKSMIYASVDRQDPRVKGVLDYVAHNYSVDENPGQGQRGLYYYLQTMTKALALVDSPTLTLSNGSQVNWQADMVAKLSAGQRADGSWVNPDGRFMESMPELVTAYAMISLRQLLPPAKK